MNILIVSYYQIYPFTGGSSIAQFGVLENLSHKCNISLIIPQEYKPNKKEINELQTLLPKVKIYIFEQSDNLSTSDTLNSKNFGSNVINTARHLINIFKILLRKKNITQKNVINQKEIPSIEDEFASMYLYNPYLPHKKQYIDKINEIIIQDKIDVVQLEFDENIDLVTALPGTVKKVFIEHECRFNRIETHIKAKQINSFYSSYIHNYYKCIEISFLKKFDGIITFTESEYEILKWALNSSSNIDLFISPFPILDQYFIPIDRNNFCKPTKLVFVGWEEHFPNKDAIEWFIEEVALEIFRKFGLKLYVVGEWHQQTVDKYKGHPSGVEFTGFVDDLYEVTKNSISIAPLRIGGGLRSKILLSMAQGIPVIATKLALDGINSKHLESVIIAEDKKSFCWAIEYLLEDLERTFMICKNAQAIIKNYYSQSVICEQRYRFYLKLLGNDKLEKQA
ncbi:MULTISPECIES: glycosyltransferase [unclassified Anabaena]|uniref:glycosyltransferase n=1 Tax=unclassified Anabaena TaxID=2619674 RepID=UPI0008308FF9|nr:MULTISPECIES: glycosyltransferase [unclassified Anabaena]